MAHRMLWTVAVLLAAAALVAGCMEVNVPRPYVNASVGGSKEPSPQQQRLVTQMDRKELESEYLRLVGENDSLRIKMGDLKRELKSTEGERDRYKVEVERLRDENKDLRKR
jgi:hypothetical protein